MPFIYFRPDADLVQGNHILVCSLQVLDCSFLPLALQWEMYHFSHGSQVVFVSLTINHLKIKDQI